MDVAIKNQLPFKRHGMKFIQIARCRYCDQINACSKMKTCIDCKTKLVSMKEKRKRQRRKKDPIRLAAFNKKQLRRQRDRYLRMKIEDPEKFKEYSRKLATRNRNAERRKSIAKNQQVISQLQKKLSGDK